MPKISVIIPVYNTAPYLARCLDSVCRQTLQDIEIICINDSSTDNSLEILREYERKDKRLKIINFEKNKGASAARNKGIDTAQGEYIGFVDGDNYIDLDFYEKLFSRAAQTDADAVKGNLKMFYPQSNTFVQKDFFNLNDKISKEHPAYFYFTFTTAIYKTSFIRKHDIRFPVGFVHMEDNIFSIKAAFFYETLCVIADANYYYVERKWSASRAPASLERIESIIKVSNMAIDLLNDSKIDSTHYSIVFNFMVEQVEEWCYTKNISDEWTILMVDNLIDLYKKCKYRKDCLHFHFRTQKNTQNPNNLKFISALLRKNINRSKDA